MSNNNGLLIHDNFSDIILHVRANCYDGSHRKLTLLFDSFDDWRKDYNIDFSPHNTMVEIFGSFGVLFINMFQLDEKIESFFFQYSNVIAGQKQDWITSRPYIREGQSFVMGSFDRDGNMTSQ